MTRDTILRRLERAAAGWGKGVARSAGLRVRRAGLDSRFEAMADTLTLLHRSGYTPRAVIDGGANLGQWATLAMQVFPDAVFHLVEPQRDCVQSLRASFTGNRVHVYPVALTAPGVTTVRMASVGATGTNTGAFVTSQSMPADVHVAEADASTLDELFHAQFSRTDRLLMKLDLEGHEIEALKGAAALLPNTEVIVSEVAFFDVFNQGHALFDDLLRHLAGHDFVLYDFAALYPRARDQRLRMGDAVFVRRDSALCQDVSWD